MAEFFSIGLDFGTSSVRGVLVSTADGRTVCESVFAYPHGEAGVIISAGDANLARQNPQDYVDGTVKVIRDVVEQAAAKNISGKQIIGIGVDTTGSSPIPLDEKGTPLAFLPRFAGNPDAMCWLWKDHTSHAEAAEITSRARQDHPEYLAKIGGIYSSEWFWAKLLHCARVNPEVFAAAATWVEHADFMPALLTGTTAPEKIKRGVCAAGHKGLYSDSWGGYPAEDFLGSLHPELARIRRSLPAKAYSIDESAGGLAAEWADKLGLEEGIPVAVGAFDAHLGGVGAGIRNKTLVKNIGTSCCDIAVWPLQKDIADVPGLCGIVPGSVLPGFHGLEAGQSAIGDIFNWFAELVDPARAPGEVLKDLEKEALQIKPGKSGLVALDWHNGNRTILVDQRLTGMFVGLSLHTTRGQMYRALVEATAFGARAIIERFKEYDVTIEQVVACGGIPYKSPMLVQIYADVFNMPIKLSRSTQTAALGSAIAGAVVAGKRAGGWDDYDSAMNAMTGLLDIVYTPQPEAVKAYNELYPIYRQIHDSFGTDKGDGLYSVMKTLLDLRDRT